MFLRQVFRKTNNIKDIPITGKMPIGINKDGDPAAEIIPQTGGGATIVGYNSVMVCGKPHTGERRLGHDALIIIVGTDECYIFKDEEEHTRRRKTKVIARKDMKSAEEEADQVRLTAKLKEFFKEFIAEVLEAENLKQFAKKFCKIARNHCHFDRAALFKVDGVLWHPIYGEAPERKFLPSRRIVRQVYNSGAPMYVVTREKKDKELSMSIIQREIKTVLCFPLFNRFGTPIAVFYGDSSRKEIPAESFLTISYFCQHIVPYISTFLLTDDEPVSPPGKKSKPLKVPELKELKLDPSISAPSSKPDYRRLTPAYLDPNMKVASLRKVDINAPKELDDEVDDDELAEDEDDLIEVELTDE